MKYTIIKYQPSNIMESWCSTIEVVDAKGDEEAIKEISMVLDFNEEIKDTYEPEFALSIVIAGETIELIGDMNVYSGYNQEDEVIVAKDLLTKARVLSKQKIKDKKLEEKRIRKEERERKNKLKNDAVIKQQQEKQEKTTLLKNMMIEVDYAKLLSS